MTFEDVQAFLRTQGLTSTLHVLDAERTVPSGLGDGARREILDTQHGIALSPPKADPPSQLAAPVEALVSTSPLPGPFVAVPAPAAPAMDVRAREDPPAIADDEHVGLLSGHVERSDATEVMTPADATDSTIAARPAVDSARGSPGASPAAAASPPAKRTSSPSYVAPPYFSSCVECASSCLARTSLSCSSCITRASSCLTSLASLALAAMLALATVGAAVATVLLLVWAVRAARVAWIWTMEIAAHEPLSFVIGGYVALVCSGCALALGIHVAGIGWSGMVRRVRWWCGSAELAALPESIALASTAERRRMLDRVRAVQERLRHAPAAAARKAPLQHGTNEPPAVAQEVELSEPTLGIKLRDDDDGAVIRRLKPGSQAEALGVPIGGKITSVNGEAAATNKNELNAQLTIAGRPLVLSIMPPALDTELAEQVEAMIRTFDVDGGSIISPDEFHALIVRADPTATLEKAKHIYDELLRSGYDADDDGQLSVAELTTYWLEMNAKRSKAAAPARARNTRTMEDANAADGTTSRVGGALLAHGESAEGARSSTGGTLELQRRMLEAADDDEATPPSESTLWRTAWKALTSLLTIGVVVMDVHSDVGVTCALLGAGHTFWGVGVGFVIAAQYSLVYTHALALLECRYGSRNALTDAVTALEVADNEAPSAGSVLDAAIDSQKLAEFRVQSVELYDLPPFESDADEAFAFARWKETEVWEGLSAAEVRADAWAKRERAARNREHAARLREMDGSDHRDAVGVNGDDLELGLSKPGGSPSKPVRQADHSNALAHQLEAVAAAEEREARLSDKVAVLKEGEGCVSLSMRRLTRRRRQLSRLVRALASQPLLAVDAVALLAALPASWRRCRRIWRTLRALAARPRRLFEKEDGVLSEYHLFKWFGLPVGCSALDALLLIEPLGVLTHPRLPTSFLEVLYHYRASRVALEAASESAPQSVLQSVAYLQLMRSVSDGAIPAVAHELVRSILLSLASMLCAWAGMCADSSALRVPISQRVDNLWRADVSLPLDALMSGALTSWTCPRQIHAHEAAPLCRALAANCSLQTVDMRKAGLDLSVPEDASVVSAIPLLGMLGHDPLAMRGVQRLFLCPTINAAPVPLVELRGGREGGISATLTRLRRRPVMPLDDVKAFAVVRRAMCSAEAAGSPNSYYYAVGGAEVNARALLERPPDLPAYTEALARLIFDGALGAALLDELLDVPMLACVGYDPITLTTPDLSRTVLDGPGLSSALVGRRATFRCRIIDAEGHPALLASEYHIGIDISQSGDEAPPPASPPAPPTPTPPVRVRTLAEIAAEDDSDQYALPQMDIRTPLSSARRLIMPSIREVEDPAPALAPPPAKAESAQTDALSGASPDVQWSVSEVDEPGVHEVRYTVTSAGGFSLHAWVEGGGERVELPGSPFEVSAVEHAV